MNRTSGTAALCAALFATGCADELPNPAEAAWKSLEVEYCLPNGETRILKSEQAGALEQFRSGMAPREIKGLEAVLKSDTNELRLTLANGKKWNFYYRDRPTSVTYHDPDAPKRSYSAEVSDALYGRIASALVGAGGPPIALKGECKLPSMTGKQGDTKS